MITITDSAKIKILEILYDENPNSVIRVSVLGGGCAGFSYQFQIDESQNEDDFAIDTGKFKVVVDAASMQYLEGATIDYKQELMGSNFVISNPNATGSCGCGSSFSV